MSSSATARGGGSRTPGPVAALAGLALALVGAAMAYLTLLAWWIYLHPPIWDDQRIWDAPGLLAITSAEVACVLWRVGTLSAAGATIPAWRRGLQRPVAVALGAALALSGLSGASYDLRWLGAHRGDPPTASLWGLAVPVGPLWLCVSILVLLLGVAYLRSAIGIRRPSSPPAC